MAGALIVGSFLLLVAIIFLTYGLWQVAFGRNLPGILSWGYLPRHRPKKSLTWTQSRWRINGFVLLAMAVALGGSGFMWLHR